MEELTGRDRRVAVVVALGTAVVLAGAGWLVVAPHGPAVPDDSRETLSMSAASVRAGSSLTIFSDDPVDRAVTSTLVFSRWDDGEWGEDRLLDDGQWSEPLGDPFMIMYSVGGPSVTSWELDVPWAATPGDYLVCLPDEHEDEPRKCGLLTIE